MQHALTARQCRKSLQIAMTYHILTHVNDIVDNLDVAHLGKVITEHLMHLIKHFYFT